MGLFNRTFKKKAIIIDEDVIEIDVEEKDEAENLHDENSSSNQSMIENQETEFNKSKMEVEFNSILSLKLFPYMLSVISVIFSLIGAFIILCGGNIGYVVFNCLAIISTIAAIVCTAITEFKSGKMVVDYRYLFILVSIATILL